MRHSLLVRLRPETGAARRVWALALGGLLALTSIGCAQPNQKQAAGQAGGAATADNFTTQARSEAPTGIHTVARARNQEPARSKADTIRTSSPKTSASTRQDSGWHHFGENASTQAAPAASARQRFETSDVALNTSSESSATGDYGTSQMDYLSMEMFEMVNRARQNPVNSDGGGRARPLHWSERLAAVARQHSLDMIRQGYFGHVNPQGKSLVNRLDAAGVPWQAEGENIAVAPTMAEAERTFMNEPRYQQNHRWNILNPDYTEVGIGIVQGPDGEYYITQDFIGRTSGQ